MNTVTVIGLGQMGMALALVLARGGWRVTVWNRSPGKEGAAVAAGAVAAPSLAEAVAASGIVLTCLKSQAVTREVLAKVAAGLRGRAVVELSGGSAADAEALVALLEEAGAGWQIGMINAWPEGVGRAETAILCAGPEAVWERVAPMLRCLGGASAHVGTAAAAVPGLFAAMFTARQGFLFGLIYAAAVARRAGLSPEVLVRLMPVTQQMMAGYAEVFARSVPGQAYDDASATLAVYLDSFEDALATFASTNTADGLPRLMRDLAARGVAEGRGAQELTALVEVLDPR